MSEICPLLNLGVGGVGGVFSKRDADPVPHPPALHFLPQNKFSVLNCKAIDMCLGYINVCYWSICTRKIQCCLQT